MAAEEEETTRTLRATLEGEGIDYPRARMPDLIVEYGDLQRFLRIIRAYRDGAPSRPRP